jgi:hypothetical protein
MYYYLYLTYLLLLKVKLHDSSNDHTFSVPRAPIYSKIVADDPLLIFSEMYITEEEMLS